MCGHEYLGMLILVGEELLDCNVLFFKCSYSGQSLQSHGDVRVKRTAS